MVKEKFKQVFGPRLGRAAHWFLEDGLWGVPKIDWILLAGVFALIASVAAATICGFSAITGL